MSLLGRKRTRLSDRDQVVDALGAAYADGQIDEHEHELRVARALRAAEVQTLRAQIHDLQIPADHPAAALLERPTHPGAVARDDVPRRPRRRRWAVAAAVLLVGGAGVGVVAATTGEDDQEELDLFTVACLEDMVADIEEEFGSTEVVAVELHDTWAWVRVPTGDGGRYQLYTYSEDGFSQHQGGSVAEADPDLVDLTDLDLDRLVDLVTEAPERLGMDGELETVVAVTDDYAGTHYAGVVLGAQDVPPHLEIDLTNEFMERASLTTDLTGGRVLHERPLDREESGG